jgi:hypothetical protein
MGVMRMRKHALVIRAGEIGPIRREIEFEPPLPARPAPVEDPAVTPDRQPKEPVPVRR